MGTTAVRAEPQATPGPKVQFDRDVRPILSDNCFPCHGPDATTRKADLRLDRQEDVFRDRSGFAVIVPGKVDESELIRRTTSTDPDQLMPPPKSQRRLTTPQIDLLRRWVEQGASWKRHWSFVTPQRPGLPKIEHQDWPRNALDFLILKRMELNGLEPAVEADKATLIRRVTLDLTGLPPKPEEIDAFCADTSPGAYEKAVDRLLNDPAYGERMALEWLDLARYADTNGYEEDNERTMWPWRDWVISAFNQNLPYDQFTIQQLAGDLLPSATLPQQVATGFNRNHRTSAEGGSIAEELRVEYVVDRVQTTAAAWLGLTLGCARCHDHKYDPISQRDFYRFFAFFNNVPEKGLDGDRGNSVPTIKVATPETRQRIEALSAALAVAEHETGQLERGLGAAEAAWETALTAQRPSDPDKNLVLHLPLDGSTTDRVGSANHAQFELGRPAYARGLIGEAADFDGRRIIDAGDTAGFERTEAFSLAAWVFPRVSSTGALVAKGDDSRSRRGYDLSIQDGIVSARISHQGPGNAIAIHTQSPLELGQWYHVCLTYDGSSRTEGMCLFIDGRPAQVETDADGLTATIRTEAPLQIGARILGFPFALRIDDLRIYDRCLPPSEVEALAVGHSLGAIAVPVGRQTSDQRQTIRRFFLAYYAPRPYREVRQRRDRLATEKKRWEESVATTMVMQEMDHTRDTFVLVRGQYDRHGEKVTAGVPAVLPPFPQNAPANRLGLARWLIDPSHPLTARVAVNRFWKMYFGTGLVPTIDDFGVQGELPTHPELLDWLATEFVRSGWDVKAIQKQIVLSATYRQSSKLTRNLLDKDPGNRLLARGPRLRLPAELIRDQALAVSGLLVRRLGGPSVKPYQPAGLWEELASGIRRPGQFYEQDHGAGLYRRSLYTYWKRTVPPASLATFDAPNREACTVDRSRTNTPLQAMVLLNDPTYVEAARSLAQRTLTEGGAAPARRIAAAFRQATGRAPTPEELHVLRNEFDLALRAYCADPGAARRLVEVGESPCPARLEPAQLAAFTTVCSVILNLDETITKE